MIAGAQSARVDVAATQHGEGMTSRHGNGTPRRGRPVTELAASIRTPAVRGTSSRECATVVGRDGHAAPLADVRMTDLDRRRRRRRRRRCQRPGAAAPQRSVGLDAARPRRPSADVAPRRGPADLRHVARRRRSVPELAVGVRAPAPERVVAADPTSVRAAGRDTSPRCERPNLRRHLRGAKATDRVRPGAPTPQCSGGAYRARVAVTCGDSTPVGDCVAAELCRRECCRRRVEAELVAARVLSPRVPRPGDE